MFLLPTLYGVVVRIRSLLIYSPNLKNIFANVSMTVDI